jgi:hypothetical protein
MISYYEYFKYVDRQLAFILENRSIISTKTRELFILRERLIRILNPKIQLLIYSDSINDNKVYFYAIITHLSFEGAEVISEIELDELLPDGCDEFNIYEFLTNRLIVNIKFKAYEYLKQTIEIPNNLDFEREGMKISHHNDSEKYANYFLSMLRDSIENLHVQEIEDKALLKQLNDIKKHSKRLFNSLENLQILDLSLKRA